MSKQHRCAACGEVLTVRRGARRYGRGINVTLTNVEIRTCESCGEEYEVIPNVENLHKVIATSLAKKPSPLTPGEIRFLRTYLGYSSRDFADLLGVRAETVTRWENPATGGMTPLAERFLRLLVLVGKRIADYGFDRIEPDSSEIVKPTRLEPRPNGWAVETVDQNSAAASI